MMVTDDYRFFRLGDKDMTHESKLKEKIKSGDFVVTAEILPKVTADISGIESSSSFLNNGLAAVNVADNPHGPVLSSLAGSISLKGSGIEPVYQIVTRDRNRIALQSDLLGAVALGIRNVLCLSGYHQALTGNPESINVYDIDSIQLLSLVKKMRDEGTLLNGETIIGEFPVFVGAVASPHMEPIDLSILRLLKKVNAGAQFIQTAAVFDMDKYDKWMEEVNAQGIHEKTAIIAGVLPLSSAKEAETLKDFYTDMSIPEDTIHRLRDAGDEESQQQEGLAICVETINQIKQVNGVRGIHILSGGREHMVPDIIARAEL
jgi:methylenetetrahydrofolate reductase (NADPH)